MKRKPAKDADKAQEFREAVIARARGHCERCGHRAPLQAHHLCSRARGVGHAMLHHPLNGAALCVECHTHVHGRECGSGRWLHRRDYLEGLLENSLD